MDGAEEDPGGTLEPQVGVGCAILVVQHVRLLRSSGERGHNISKSFKEAESVSHTLPQSSVRSGSSWSFNDL